MASPVAKVTMPISPTDRRSAFTLVELMVVVLLIGIATSVVFMRLDNILPGQRLRSAAVTVIGAADFAKSEARLRQSNVTLTYDLDKQVITVTAPPLPVVETDENGDEVEPRHVAAVMPEEPEVLFSETLPDGVQMKTVYYSESRIAYGGAVGADFRPSGAVGEHMVVLKEASGGTMSVYVPALSGSAFVVDNGVTYGQVRASRRLK
jgi:prepilin-type N-terminal cleavage/methylation domain-containing protein